MNTKTLEIPQQADRCVVLIAHPAHNGDLTEDDRAAASQSKSGNIELVGTLASRFGTPTVHSGQSNVSIMTAVTTGQNKITPLRLLDKPDSHRQARKRARKVLFEASAKKPLVVAYGDHGIVNKAIGARNVASKNGIKPIAEAAVVFIDKHGQVVGTHKQDLLVLAAA
jgi:hypothetical protein